MASNEQSNRTGASDALSESGVDEEGEYESDSEGTSALALRRREASDDEEDDRELRSGRRTFGRGFSGDDDRARPPFSDDDADYEGAPPADEEEEVYDDAMESIITSRSRNRNEDEDDEDLSKHHRENLENAVGKGHVGSGVPGSGSAVSRDGVADDKKDAEPFVVPTAGAFYMHDDRFRDNGGARPRRSAGGRKLWEAKDEKPWVHDRFEELSLQEETRHGQGLRAKGGRGRLRGLGRGWSRGKDTGYVKGRGSREKFFGDSFVSSSRRGAGRGRGLRRPKMDESKQDDHGHKESPTAVLRTTVSSSFEMAESNSRQIPKQTPVSAPLQPVVRKTQLSVSKKPTGGSILNSASPPFYPSGSISQNLTGLIAGSAKTVQGADEKVAERDTQQGMRVASSSRNAKQKGITGVSSVTVTKQASMPHNTPSLAHVSDAVEVEAGLHMGLMRGVNTMQHQLLKTGSGSMLQQQRLPKAEGKPQLIIEHSSVSIASQQTGRGLPLTQSGGLMRAQQSHQQPQTIKQGQVLQQQSGQSLQTTGPSTPPTLKAALDVKPAPSSPGDKPASGVSGRSTQGASLQGGRGSFVYGGGSSGATNGLRSVVQFAGQPQAGLGVPAVGVALPGYSSQPQFGFANSEVTWVPILAGGGALGSNYTSPYISVDGASSAVYYTQPSSQPATFAVSGRDVNGVKLPSSSTWKPPTRSEFGNDEFAQRQSKPRRYSEMNFGQ